LQEERFARMREQIAKENIDDQEDSAVAAFEAKKLKNKLVEETD